MPESIRVADLISDWEEADLGAKRKERRAERARSGANKVREKLRKKLQEEIDRCVGIYHETYPEALHFNRVYANPEFEPDAPSIIINIFTKIIASDRGVFYTLDKNHARHPDGERLLGVLEEHLGWQDDFGFEPRIEEAWIKALSQK